MSALRKLILLNRSAAMLLIAASLALKAVVPAGFMVNAHALVLTVEVCADATGIHQSKRIVVPLRGEPAVPAAGKGGSACPFATLWASGLAGDLHAFVAVAVAFALARGFSPVDVPQIGRATFLRPPLRAPPHLS